MCCDILSTVFMFLKVYLFSFCNGPSINWYKFSYDDDDDDDDDDGIEF